MTLYDGYVNETYEVVKIDIDNRTKKRLQDMGITTGVNIQIMSKLGTHAYILKIRGSRVALGKEITSKIEVLDTLCETCDKRKE